MSSNESPFNASHSIEPWKLTAYLLGELSESERAQIERRLEVSPELRAECQSLQKTLGILQATLGDGVAPAQASLTPEQLSSLETALANNALSNATVEPNRLLQLPFYRRRRFAAALAIAACVPVAWLTWNSLERPGSDLALAPKTTSIDVDESIAAPVDPMAAPNMATVAKPSDAKTSEAMPVEVKQNAAPNPVKEDEVALLTTELTGSAQNSGAPARPLDLYRDNAYGANGQGDATGTAATPQLKFAPGSGGYGIEAKGAGLDGSGPGTGQFGTDRLAGGYGGGYYGGYGGSGYGVGSEGFGGYGAGMGGLGGSVPGVGGPAAAPPARKSLDELETFAIQPNHRFLEPGAQGGAPALPPELRSNLKRFPPAPPVVESSGDRFDRIVEKPFTEAEKEPVTTFSIDVDTASYSKIRQSIQQRGQLPTPDMVRIEEMINYFQYEYPAPDEDSPFAASLRMVDCPWNRSHKLVRVGIQAKKIQTEDRPRCNLVFLLDVSGSMNEPNKLPLVQRSLSLLAQRLREDDRVAIVVYAGAAGCVLPSTPGSEKDRILAAIYNLQAGGSTNGGEGIRLAYSIAQENFIEGGSNRVILCTDGDFNVGVTNTDSLVDLLKEQAKKNIFLTCLGYGAGNYNDSMMEKISKDGNGVYGMVDSDREAKKLMVDQLTGTLVTIAKDVKIQMDFNPNLVRSYRLIGYEDRQLTNADFSNDRKDAGDIGAGHSVTAFYEIVPTSLVEPNLTPAESESKYKRSTAAAEPNKRDVEEELLREWLTLKIRSKRPDASESTKQEFILSYRPEASDSELDRDLLWSTAVAEFGLLLRRSKMAPQANWDAMLERASRGAGGDEHRAECLELMRTAQSLAGRVASSE
ncbi:von Willebrand factor [Pirellula sp. SH-Sr6A]|uniref:VWA domain-containing protein n=1 Tax=Pirellula sp. SH-Sr6A TaxID=1632865 RepID=UPI00078E9FCB|nr:VWA domain-containing protein [Pirellula sp. SH-Sr6A]AMV32900.1 von Willebrand factor [Pirellula sp. SH-Sr6A]